MAVNRDAVLEDIVMKKVRDDWHQAWEARPGDGESPDLSPEDRAALLDRASELFYAAIEAGGDGSWLLTQSVRTVMGGLFEEDLVSIREEIDAGMKMRGVGPVLAMELVLKAHVWLERRELEEKRALGEDQSVGVVGRRRKRLE